MVVTGDPVIVRPVPTVFAATLVTVPGCAPVAIPASLVKSAEDMKPATVLFAAACKVPPPLLPWLMSVKRVAGSVPVDRSLALPEVAIEARPVIVLAACVPVCVALSRSCASVALAVAPAAIPASFVKSAEDMKPDTVVLASGCVCEAAAAPMSARVHVYVVLPFTDLVVEPIVMFRAVPQFVVVMLADPLNEVPLIVRAVVSVAALATDLVESAVLSTFERPTSDFVRV